MKIAIIGAGNMGGAIACGLAASGEYKAGEIVCSNPSCGKLEALKSRIFGNYGFNSRLITKRHIKA